MANTSQNFGNDPRILRNGLLVYILNNATTKQPIKQSEMCEILGKVSNKKFQEKLPGVVEILKNVYGIILKEVPMQKGSVKKFICYSDDNVHAIEELRKEQKRDITLLFMILSYIFLMGGSIYEEQLQNFLESLHIDYAEEHSFFGKNLKKLILDTFIKQLYLKREKSDAELDVDVRYLLSWGFRARMEFKKKHVLNVAAKLMGQSPEFYQTQYVEACAEDDDDEENEDEVTVIEE